MYSTVSQGLGYVASPRSLETKLLTSVKATVNGIVPSPVVRVVGCVGTMASTATVIINSTHALAGV